MSDCARETEFEHRLTKVEDRSKSNTTRLDELEAWQHDQSELVKSVSVLANEQQHITKDVGEIKTAVNSLTGKSGKRWEGLVDKALWLIIGAALAALLAQAGVAV